ncbi:MAG: hypothetical protein RLZZ519_361 [Bacteroidota bacterium]
MVHAFWDVLRPSLRKFSVSCVSKPSNLLGQRRHSGFLTGESAQGLGQYFLRLLSRHLTAVFLPIGPRLQVTQFRSLQKIRAGACFVLQVHFGSATKTVGCRKPRI